LAQVFGAADDAAYVAALRTKHKAQIVRADLKAAAKGESKADAKGEAAKAGDAK
jgi:hypothetical protein